MSKMNTEKKLVRRKLVLNREVLRTLSEQTLKNVAGGDREAMIPTFLVCRPTGWCTI